MNIEHTVGQNDELFRRYSIEGTNHTRETEELCEVIRALEAERDRLRGAAQFFIDVFDDDNAWIENSDAADYAMEQLRAALQEGEG